MRLLTFVVLSCFAFTTFAQKHDSVKYANGYLHYHEYGKGEPVILLTGGPGAGHTQLETVAKALESNYRAILLEQRGTGSSMPVPFDKTTVNISTAMSDLNLLMDHLKITQAHLLGHSWGAMLAMTHAANHPQRVKSLLLISPGPFKLNQEIFGIYGANRESRLSLEDQKRREYIFGKVNSGNASESEQTEKYRWELAPMLYDRTTIDSLVTIINKGGLNPQTGGFIFQSLKPDFTEGVQKFQKPIHIICGAQDPGAFVSYEAKIYLPQAKLHWINKCGHFPMFERPEEFNKELLNVLGEVVKK
jgi:pimeloyl-ACP methyl ester carboxylesterase